jgi:hypothetical protein
MLSRACEKHALLDFRDEAGGGEKTIGEGLQEVDRLRADVEMRGWEYVEHGHGAKEAWEEAMALWIGTLEGVTGLMHVALDEAGIDAAEEYALDAAYDEYERSGNLVDGAGASKGSQRDRTRGGAVMPVYNITCSTKWNDGPATVELVGRVEAKNAQKALSDFAGGKVAKRKEILGPRAVKEIYAYTLSGWAAYREDQDERELLVREGGFDPEYLRPDDPRFRKVQATDLRGMSLDPQVEAAFLQSLFHV